VHICRQILAKAVGKNLPLRAPHLLPQYLLCVVHGKLGDHDKAIEFCRQILFFDSADPLAAYLLGQANGALGTPLNSVDFYKDALTRDSRDIGAALKVAEIYIEMGNLDLAKAVGTKPQVVAGLVQHLLKSGALVRLSPDIVVHAAVLAEIEEKVATQKGRTMSVADFRDLLGLSRKYLIPLLEHLDRRRRTRRVGDARVVE